MSWVPQALCPTDGHDQGSCAPRVLTDSSALGRGRQKPGLGHERCPGASSQCPVGLNSCQHVLMVQPSVGPRILASPSPCLMSLQLSQNDHQSRKTSQKGQGGGRKGKWSGGRMTLLASWGRQHERTHCTGGRRPRWPVCHPVGQAMLVLPPGWSLGSSSPAQTVGRGLVKVPQALRRQYKAVGEPQEGHTAPGIPGILALYGP